MNSFLKNQPQSIKLDPGLNVLSVDLECWEQLIFRRLTGELIPCSESTVQSTNILLDLFEKKGVRATFFVVGAVAEAFPDLIERIHMSGHEIGIHGYTHTTLDLLSPAQFRDEIRKSITFIRSLITIPIVGFRAPEFSLGSGTQWGLEILAEEGIKYDSSIVPCAGRKHGIADFPRGAARLTSGSQSIIEVPPSTVSFFGRNWLAAGGSYFRLLPEVLLRRIVRRVNRDGLPFVLYCHPYEFSAERLSIRNYTKKRNLSAALKMEYKYNLLRDTMPRKLSMLLDEFRFAPFSEVLANAL